MPQSWFERNRPQAAQPPAPAGSWFERNRPERLIQPRRDRAEASPQDDNGLIERGNINLVRQPRVSNPDGSVSTVRSISVGIDGAEVLIPTVSADGRGILSDDEAVAQYERTGRHLGRFRTPEAATRYAEQLHSDYERGRYDPQEITPPPFGPPTLPTPDMGGPPPVPDPDAGFLERVRDLAISGAKGVVSVPEAIVGLAEAEPIGAAARAVARRLGQDAPSLGEGLERAGISFEGIKGALDQYYSDEFKKERASFQQAKGFVDKAVAALSDPAIVANAVVESIPGMLAGGAVGRGLKAAGVVSDVVAGAAGEGLVSAGSSAEGIRQQSGELGPGQAGIALTSGAVTGVLGVLGGRVANALGIKDVETMLAGGLADSAARKNLVRAVILGAGQEGLLEEFPQSIQEQVAQNAATGRPLWEGVPESAVLGALAGGIMGAGAQGASAVRGGATSVETPPAAGPATGPGSAGYVETPRLGPAAEPPMPGSRPAAAPPVTGPGSPGYVETPGLRPETLAPAPQPAPAVPAQPTPRLEAPAATPEPPAEIVAPEATERPVVGDVVSHNGTPHTVVRVAEDGIRLKAPDGSYVEVRNGFSIEEPQPEVAPLDTPVSQIGTQELESGEHPAIAFTKKIEEIAQARGDDQYLQSVQRFRELLERGGAAGNDAIYTVPGMEGSEVLWFNPRTGEKTGRVKLVADNDAASAGRYYKAKLVERFGDDSYRDSRFDDKDLQLKDGSVSLIFPADWNYVGIEEAQTPTARTPRAEFLGHQEGVGPLFNIDAPGHPLDKSTVSQQTLEQEGIPVPEVPVDRSADTSGTVAPAVQQPAPIKQAAAPVPQPFEPGTAVRVGKRSAEVLKTPQTALKRGKVRVRYGSQKKASLVTIDDVRLPKVFKSQRAKVVQPADADDAVIDELYRIYEEMDAIEYTGKSYNDPGRGRGGDLEVTGGSAGVPVYNDIVGMADADGKTPFNYTRGQVKELIADFLFRAKRSVVSDLAYDVAQRRLAGDKTLSKPMLPPMKYEPPPPKLQAAEPPAEVAPEGVEAYATAEDIAIEENTAETSIAAREGDQSAVDLTDRGDVQPRLPAAGAVREQDQTTPEIADVPFSLSRETAERGEVQNGLFGSGLPEESTKQPSVTRQKLADIEQAALKRIQDRGTFKGGRITAGLPIDDMADLVLIGAAKIGRGTVKFAEWSADMLSEFGDSIKPHLRRLYVRSRRAHETKGTGFGPEGTVVTRRQLAKIARLRGSSIETQADRARMAGYEVEQIPPPPRPRQGAVSDVPPAKAIPEKRVLEFPSLQKLDHDIQPAVADILTKADGFQRQRRDVQGWERTEALAKGMELPLQKLRPGTAATAEELSAYANAITWTLAERKRLRDKGTDITQGELMKLSELTDQAVMLVGSYRGLKAETGRALNILRAKRSIADSMEPKFIERALATPGFKRDLELISRKLDEAAGSPERLLKILQTMNRTRFDILQAYVYNNMLSGPKTHLRNFIGNSFNLGANMLAPLAAGPIDAVRSRASGKTRSVFTGESNIAALGAIESMLAGWTQASYAFRKGYRLEDIDSALEGNFDFRRVEIPGIPSRVAGERVHDFSQMVFNWPSRALVAADEFFRTMARGAERHAAAYAQARREGVTGKQRIAKRMTAILTATDGPDAAIRDTIERESEEFAARMVFQERPGEFVSGILKIKNSQKASVRWAAMTVIPFVRTAGSIVKQGFEWTPVGFGMEEVQKGGRAGAQAQGRAALGSLMMLPLGMLAWAGMLTGSPPDDPGEREEFYAQGKLPNAIRVGNYWVRYVLFQPFSVAAAALASAIEPLRKKAIAGEDIDDASLSESIVRAFAGAGSSLLDQSFLSGLDTWMNAVQQPDRSARRLVTTMLAPYVPQSGMLRSIANAVDPYYRRPRGAVQGLQAINPWASENLAPLVTRHGGPAKRPPDSLLWRGFVVPMVSRAQTDKVTTELGRLGVRKTRHYGNFSQRGEQFAKTEDQKALIGLAVGYQRKYLVEAVVHDPDYDTWDDERRREEIEDAYTRASRDVRRLVVDRQESGLKWTLENLLPEETFRQIGSDSMAVRGIEEQ